MQSSLYISALAAISMTYSNNHHFQSLYSLDQLWSLDPPPRIIFWRESILKIVEAVHVYPWKTVVACLIWSAHVWVTFYVVAVNNPKTNTRCGRPSLYTLDETWLSVGPNKLRLLHFLLHFNFLTTVFFSFFLSPVGNLLALKVHKFEVMDLRCFFHRLFRIKRAHLTWDWFLMWAH